MANTYTLVVSDSFGTRAVASGYKTPIVLSVSSGLGIQAVPADVVNRYLKLSVASGLGVQPVPTAVFPRVFNLSVSDGIGVAPVSGGTAPRVFPQAASTGLGVQAVPTISATTTYALSVAAGFGLSPGVAASDISTHLLSVAAGLGIQAVPSLNVAKVLSVAAGLNIQPLASANATHVLSTSTGLKLTGSATPGPVYTLSVATTVNMSSAASMASLLAYLSAASGLGMSASVSEVKGTSTVTTSVGFGAVATCQVILAAGLSDTGLDYPLLDGISGDSPLTFAETPAGVVLMANGIDPMIRWDALSGSADFAGVAAPTAAPTMAASGFGSITGRFRAYYRWIDGQGNPSNFSPCSSELYCGTDRAIDAIDLNSSTGVVTITSYVHELATGADVTIGGVDGIPLSGTFDVTVLDPDRFTLQGIYISSGSWQGGGSWSAGAATITYGGIPAPSQSKVARLQILRNAEGEIDSLYVDVDTTTLTSGAYTSTQADSSLITGTAVAYRTDDDRGVADKYSVPPSNRPYLCAYSGRVFAAGDANYYAGCVQVSSGSQVVTGIGTKWPLSFVGRTIWVKGASKRYGVVSVDPVGQTLTLDGPYVGPSQPFATYVIRSSAADRKMVQWNDAEYPEAWPAWNSLAVPEDGDEIVGLFVLSSYLYVVERRHIYQVQFSDGPESGGHVFLVALRGAVSHRMIVAVEDSAYIVDESGAYKFSGGAVQPISDPVQVMFDSDGLAPTYQLDRQADATLWHGSLDPIKTTIRWFIAFKNEPPLHHCMCYNYRTDRWWVEDYPTQITSSCTGTLADVPNPGIPSGQRRALVGTEARTVLVLSEGSLDLVPASGTLQGHVTSSTSTSLTDATASFAASLGGVPVSIVSGTGEGQTRLVSSNTTTTLTVIESWTTIPDTTSVYQIGGVPYEWRSGWMDLEEDEDDTNRDFVLTYQPLVNPSAVSIQFYYDHSTTPYVWAIDQAKDGVTVAANDSNVWIDMTSTDVLPGWRVFRQAEHSDRYAYDDRFVQIRMSGVANSETVRVYQVSLRGLDQEGL